MSKELLGWMCHRESDGRRLHIFMAAFREWLFQLEHSVVDPGVLQGYKRAFQAELEKLIQRTTNAPLRSTFEAMRSCPVRTARGCAGWANYALGALLRHCPGAVNIDDSLNYLMFTLLSPVGERGNPRRPLFDMDADRPYDLSRGSPLEARYRTFLMNSVKSICSGKIRRLAATQRPPGTLSIGQGRCHGDEGCGYVSADQIPDRPGNHTQQEMLTDLDELLRVRQRQHPDLPVIDVWRGIITGDTPSTRMQRAKFGRKADAARKVIVAAVESYARSTENWHLLRLLDRFKDFDQTRADPTSPRSRYRERQPKPKVDMPPVEKDYRSIVVLMEKLGRSLTTAQAGHWRRRWTERKPRDPASPHPNRLADTLANMMKDGVLELRQTRAGGKLYVPGPRYEEFVAAEKVEA